VFLSNHEDKPQLYSVSEMAKYHLEKSELQTFSANHSEFSGKL
jgi:hypothetical protein